MALALNNLKRVDMPLNKETKPNNSYTIIWFQVFLTNTNNLYTIIWFDQSIGLAVRVFTNGLGDQGSIIGQVIPKTQKMVLDASLLNTQHYKESIATTLWCSRY